MFKGFTNLQGLFKNNMKIYPIEAGNFKLDGGAMFGVVPKTIWSRTNPADDLNLIDMAARCLLIENGKKTYSYRYRNGRQAKRKILWIL